MGDDTTLHEHWPGIRDRAFPALSAALAQDPDGGLTLPVDASVRFQFPAAVPA